MRRAPIAQVLAPVSRRSSLGRDAKPRQLEAARALPKLRAFEAMHLPALQWPLLAGSTEESALAAPVAAEPTSPAGTETEALASALADAQAARRDLGEFSYRASSPSPATGPARRSLSARARSRRLAWSSRLPMMVSASKRATSIVSSNRFNACTRKRRIQAPVSASRSATASSRARAGTSRSSPTACALVLEEPTALTALLAVRRACGQRRSALISAGAPYRACVLPFHECGVAKR